MSGGWNFFSGIYFATPFLCNVFYLSWGHFYIEVPHLEANRFAYLLITDKNVHQQRRDL